MIPKVIHYIWLGGGKKPKIFDKCYKSWKKYCPDYEIKCWDETNLDLNKYKYAKDAYDAKKYAFASDVFRFDILYNEGGIYLDIDVELLKPIDELLSNKLFFGHESKNIVNPGLIMGSISNNELLKELLNIYIQKDYVVSRENKETICTIASDFLKKLGFVLNNSLQSKDAITIYPTEYFCPMDIDTQRIKKTKNTMAIHHFNASWYCHTKKILRGTKKVLNYVTFGLAGRIYAKIKGKK